MASDPRTEALQSKVEWTRDRVFDNGWTRERVLALLGMGVFVAPLVLPRFQVYLLSEFLIVALFAIAFNLLYGYTGLLSFGHALFYAAGAYGLAIVINDAAPMFGPAFGGAEPLAVLLVGWVVGLVLVSFFAVTVGYLSVQLEEIYFALITLAFSMAFYAALIQDVGGLTQGSDGLTVLLGRLEVLGTTVSLSSRSVYYYVVLAVVLPSGYAIWRVVNSPFGMVCRAMRESPERAAALGIDVRFHQWVMFVLSAFFTGVAGLLIAPLHNVAAPGLSHWTTSAIPVVAAVIGGAHVFAGPIFGAFAFLYLRWAITRYPTLEAHWELVFGLVLVVMVLYFKQGIAGGLYALTGWLSEVEARYRRGGSRAARAHVRETLATKARETRNHVRGRFRDGGDRR